MRIRTVIGAHKKICDIDEGRIVTHKINDTFLDVSTCSPHIVRDLVFYNPKDK